MKKELAKNIVAFKGPQNMVHHCIKCMIRRDAYRVFDIKDEIKNVVDIGANLGAFSYICSKLFKDINLYCVEPTPTTFELLKENLKDIPNINFYNRAIFNANNVNIHMLVNPKNIGGNRSEVSKETTNCDCTSIQFLDVISDVKDLNKTILKIDCEGCEIHILDKLDVLKQFYQISIEYHKLPRDTREEYRCKVQEFQEKIQETHILTQSGKHEFVYRIKS